MIQKCELKVNYLLRQNKIKGQCSANWCRRFQWHCSMDWLWNKPKAQHVQSLALRVSGLDTPPTPQPPLCAEHWSCSTGFLQPASATARGWEAEEGGEWGRHARRCLNSEDNLQLRPLPTGRSHPYDHGRGQIRARSREAHTQQAGLELWAGTLDQSSVM